MEYSFLSAEWCQSDTVQVYTITATEVKEPHIFFFQHYKLTQQERMYFLAELPRSRVY